MGTIDNYGGETAYNIQDSSGQEVMKGSGWPSNSVNSFWKCLSSGGYSFTITDGYGDGLCCSYGNGGYSVKVNDEEVASGGQFGSSETKSFNVGTTAPVSPPTPAPVEQTFAPTTSVSEEEQTFAPTTSVSEEEQTSAPTTSEQTFAPTTSVSEEVVFPPTSSIAPSTPNPDPTVPTPYPTGIAPTP